MLGVVILNFNDSRNACKLTKKIRNFSNVWQVFLVDNCSTDDSMSYMQSELCDVSDVVVVKTERNGGYAYGNNFGVKLLHDSGGDMALICNTDVDFTEELVESCIEALKNGYAAVSGLMRNRDGAKMYENNYRISRYIDDLRGCFFLTRCLGKRKKWDEFTINESSREIKAVDLLPGFLFAVKTSDFFEVGGFDENTFLYCEERILGRRFRNVGKKMGLMMYRDYLHWGSVSINKSHKSVYSKMKLLYHSRLYYQCAYNHVRGIKRLVLKTAMNVSLFEFKVRDTIFLLSRKMR